MDLQQRIARVRGEIAAAARRAGRDPDAITLVGVCKTVERPVVDEAYRHGLRHFGENRVQAARAKFAADRPADLTLHLVGSLQTNKARDAVALFDLIHSLDRPNLIAELARRAAAAACRSCSKSTSPARPASRAPPPTRRPRWWTRCAPARRSTCAA
jgi:uncharacterized pyridoxal phosphate-containing UPF0001 family protein